MGITSRKWGVMPDGTPVELFTLMNGCGMEASIATYGGVITRLTAPDRAGSMADVVLGYDSLDEYLNDCCFFGCVVGRVANRIADARFTLDGVEYTLDKNHGKHQLHGGSKGFNCKVWGAEVAETVDGPCLILSYLSRDGEQGYPGNLDVTVVYTLLDDGLRMEYRATSDAATVVNLTNHSYFNLSAHPEKDCLEHVLTIPASRFMETDKDQIPTGKLANVAGGPLDFTGPAVIRSRINVESEPLSIGQGYDHYFVLDDESESLRLAGRVYEPATGRVLEVHTTKPGVQFYSGNHMPESIPGKSGVIYGFRSGFCLETQDFTDAPNRAEFPSIVLRPGDEYRHTTVYQFSVE